mmetsp:Transcript_2984/g.9130  ORF Transcript_2984/g.9130 Transcript_2984/m.9130 type:complete len:90 (-) Transcript_2984:121-390(-)
MRTTRALRTQRTLAVSLAACMQSLHVIRKLQTLTILIHTCCTGGRKYLDDTACLSLCDLPPHLLLFSLSMALKCARQPCDDDVSVVQRV